MAASPSPHAVDIRGDDFEPASTPRAPLGHVIQQRDRLGVGVRLPDEREA